MLMYNCKNIIEVIKSNPSFLSTPLPIHCPLAADESSSDGSPGSPIPDEDSVVFSQLTYLGCASVNAPRSEVEALRMMCILRSQCQVPLDVTLSVPGVSEGTVRYWEHTMVTCHTHIMQTCITYLVLQHHFCSITDCWTPMPVRRSPTIQSTRFCSVYEAMMAHQRATALPSLRATTMLRSSGSTCSAAKSVKR